MGWSVWVDGELRQAQAYAEQGIALSDAQQPRIQVIRYGSDARVLCLSLACSALWLLGYPSQALQISQEALAWAQELSHPISMTSALLLTTVLHQRRGEVQATRERAEALIALATEHGFPLRIAEGTIFRGWALVGQEEREAGLTVLRQGLMAYRATAAEAFLPSHLARLAEAYGKAGQPEEGLTALAEALAVADKTGAHFDEAELYRLKGELTLQQLKIKNLTPSTHEEAEAEEYFLKAIEIAQKQHAKSWELRAAMSLARLWRRQGKQQEAHHLLSEIYSWFTEGFDTTDLQEAKALLEELT
jgi:predicted ATPase